jgi:hypothetical protein
MTGAWELFISLTNTDSRIDVDLGDDSKYVLKGEVTILFWIELGGSFENQDVLYVPRLRKYFLSISVMENKGFSKRGQVLIRLEGAIPNIAVNISFREGKLYRLKDNLVQALVHDNDNLCELWHK